MVNIIRHPYHQQQGFSLIEVLVVMIILSIGLLALTALQLSSLRATNEAQRITSITLLAKEMADRMRANSGQLANYAGTSVTAAVQPTRSGTDCGAAGQNCTAVELKDYDVFEWISGLFDAVGFVRGSIYQTAGVAGEYTIGIQWDEDRDGNLDEATSCDGSFDAADPAVPEGCFKLRFKP